jgi:DNA-binding NarL/FixJ family response regulator
MPVRVLLVDDEPMFLEALRALLDRDDRVEIVGAADSSTEAMAIASSVHPDVALVDLRMPGMNGFDLTRTLLASEPALRVLAVSGLSHESDAQQALAAGATAFLLKGGLHHEVADAIVAAAGPLHH